MDCKQSPSDDAAAQHDLNFGPIDRPDLTLTDLDLEGDTLREECGVFGIFGHPEAAAITALGLHALQHRGQEAAGIVSFDGNRFHSERRLGLVGDTFSRREVIERLPGASAVGHVRYSTTGETILRNVQPLFAELNAGGFAVGHNGNLTNGLTLRRELVRGGAMMQSTTDTEVILHLVAQSKRNRFIDRFIEALRAIEGAYSLVSLTNKKLIGARDPLGIRPLVLGELDGCPILASETCALDIIGAKYVRDVEPGEIIVFDERGAQIHKPFPPKPPRPCIFEYIYFSRPAGARKPCRGRRGGPGAGFRRPRRAWLFQGVGRAVRTRHHPQSLCRPHLHSADPERARTRRAHEAFGQSRGDRRQAHHPD
jgi:amidophosphoribosyltransferase